MAAPLLTVADLFPDPAPGPPIASAPRAPGAGAARVVGDLLRHVRYLLTLKAHALDRWADLDRVDGLMVVLRCSRDLLAHRANPGLTHLVQELTTVLASGQEEVAWLRHGVGWLADIRTWVNIFAVGHPTWGWPAAQSTRERRA